MHTLGSATRPPACLPLEPRPGRSRSRSGLVRGRLERPVHRDACCDRECGAHNHQSDDESQHAERDRNRAPRRPPAEPERRRRGWLRRWWWVIAIGVVMSLLTTAFVVTLLVHVPYVIESPGNAEPVQELITVPPDHSYPTSDRINLVTVTVDTDVTRVREVVGRAFVGSDDRPGEAGPRHTDAPRERSAQPSADAPVQGRGGARRARQARLPRDPHADRCAHREHRPRHARRRHPAGRRHDRRRRRPDRQRAETSWCRCSARTSQATKCRSASKTPMANVAMPP